LLSARTESIKDAAKVAALKLRALYPNTESWFIPGEFGLIQTADGKNDQGYYWWEAGAAMGVCLFSSSQCSSS
jgi:mannan endo-1,6-alpha-mannosidase